MSDLGISAFSPSAALARRNVVIAIASAFALLLGLLMLEPPLGWGGVAGAIPSQCGVAALFAAAAGLLAARFGRTYIAAWLGAALLLFVAAALALHAWAIYGPATVTWAVFNKPRPNLDVYGIAGGALTGMALLLLARKRSAQTPILILGVIGAVLIAIAAAGLLAQALSINAYRPLPGLDLVGLGFFDLGVGFIAYAWYESALKHRQRTLWPALVVGIGTVTATLLLWQALTLQTENHLRGVVQAQLIAVKAQIDSHMHARIAALARMGARWQHYGRPAPSAWDYDTGLYLNHFSGLVALAWFDRDYVLRRLRTPDIATRVQVDAAFARELYPTLEIAQAWQSVALSPMRKLRDGADGFAAVLPIASGARPDGLLAAVFDSAALMSSVLNSDIAPGYVIDVQHDRRRFFRRDGDAEQSRWAQETALALYDTVWTIQLIPTQQTLTALKVRTPMLVLGFGLLLATVLVGIVYFAQRANLGRRQIKSAHEGLLREIDTRRHSEERRRHDQRFLNALLNTVDDAIVACDRDGAITVFNAAARRFFSASEMPVSVIEWLRRTPLANEDGAPAPWQRTPLPRALAGEPVRDEVYRFGERILCTNAQAIFDKPDEIGGAVLSARDITEPKQTERALRQGRRYHDLLHAVAVAANEASAAAPAALEVLARVCEAMGWPYGQYWRCQHNARGERFLTGMSTWHVPGARFDEVDAGLPALVLNEGDDLPGRVLRDGRAQMSADLSSPRDGPRASALTAAGLTAGLAFPVFVHEQVAGVLEFFTDGQPVADAALHEVMLQVGTQLGRAIEREQAVRASRESEQRFRSVTESALDAIIVLDAAAKIVWWNPAAARAFGYDLEQVLGQELDFLLAAQDRDATQQAFASLRREHVAGGVEAPRAHSIAAGRRRDASEFPVELALSRWTSNERLYFTAIVRDISERMAAEREVQQLNQELERRVEQRTAQLKAANRDLANEINERLRAADGAKRFAKQQAAVAEFGHRALVNLDIDSLIDRALHLVRDTLTVEIALMWVHTDDALDLRQGLAHGAQAAAVALGARGLAAAAIAARTPLSVPDLANDTRFARAAPGAAHWLRGSLAVPIPGDKQRFGALSVHTHRVRTFDEEDIRFLQAIANVLASAVLRHQVESERMELLLHEQAARQEAVAAHAETETARRQVAGVLESIADAFFAVDSHWRFTYVNRMAEEILARPRAELLGRELWTEFPAMRATLLASELERAARERVAVDFEVQRPSNENWYEVHAYPGDDTLSVYFHDITERRKTRDALYASELRQRLLLESVKDYAIYMMNRDGMVVSWNVGAERILGYTADEAIGAHFSSLYAASVRTREQSGNELEIAARDGRIEDEGWRIRKAGELFWANVVVTRVDDSAGTHIGFAKVVRDLTERKHAQAALAAEKERLAVTLYSIADGVIATDTHGCVLLVNKVAEELTGFTDALAQGRSVDEIFQIVDEKTKRPCPNPAQQALKGGVAVTLGANTLLRARDGCERLIAGSAAPIRDAHTQVTGVALVFRDVGEKVRMERELLKSQNLESIGLLAGGIAHDFNNILTAILGNIALAKVVAVHNPAVTGSLSEAEHACARARDLTQQLLTFSKGGAPIRTAASVGELLRETATFLLRGSNVRVAFDLAPDLWLARFDAGQISQVIDNLVINAKQAMPQGGLIEIGAHNVQREQPGAKRKHYVRISIQDRGMGISEENLPRIFDPYFTTKATGSGLGLATSYSIVKRHEGFIEVRSRVGDGTCFDIYLPASPRKAPLAPAPEAPTVAGHGRILLMDDEETILKVGAALLRHLGYEVDISHDGDEMLKRYAAALGERRPYAVVVMDLTIPGGMGGRECVEKLHALHPQARAIVSSGYSNDPIMADYRRHGFAGVITKPYQLAEFSRVIRTVIDDESSRAG